MLNFLVELVAVSETFGRLPDMLVSQDGRRLMLTLGRRPVSTLTDADVDLAEAISAISAIRALAA